jgi:diguanylate cyclase (GGDEF)-like protein
VVAELRVILVGKTGVDAYLRADDAIELVPVASAIEAMGELSQRSISNSMPSVVVVSGEVGATLHAQSNGNGKGAHDSGGDQSTRSSSSLQRFISGLRSIEPGIRIASIGGGLLPGIDISLPGSPEPSSLLAVLKGELNPDDACVSESVAGMLHAIGDDGGESIGDQRLTQLMLGGKDVVDAALGLIGSRVKVPVRFIRESTPPIGPSVPVARDSREWGYLCGNIDPAQLFPHGVWLATWLELQESQAKLRRAAFTDPLTGAWNRRYFERFLAAAISNARSKRLHATVLLFDIDNFKRYNDEFGHDAGDEILVEAVRLMRSVIRPSDRVCRIGGDEFAVVFHDPEGPRVQGSSNSVSVVELANRFQRQIIEHKFPKLSSLARGTLTISGGMAAFPWDGTTTTDLLARADQLARESKQAGKNFIKFGPGAIKAGLNSPF